MKKPQLSFACNGKKPYCAPEVLCFVICSQDSLLVGSGPTADFQENPQVENNEEEEENDYPYWPIR